MKAEFLRQLEDDIFLYCEECADADADALNARFGTPEDVASEFLSALDPVIFSRSYRSRQRVTAMVMAVLLCAALLTGCLFLQRYIAHQQANSIELVPFEGQLPEASGPAYWVRTNNGEDISYWVFDYEQNDWVNVPYPGE